MVENTNMPSSTRLLKVKDRIRFACQAAGRDPAEVQLIAVSKTQSVEAIEPVYDAGQRHFGENYVQELRDKGDSFVARTVNDITWHFIGRIQSNKIKHIAAYASYVHAVEKLSHAQALAKHARGPIKIFVSVNIAKEESKGGVAPEDVLERCAEFDAIENLELCGLMCMPPRSTDPEHSAPYFEEMAALASAGRDRGMALTELSMGMSHDFQVAIRYGATWIRVGSAIFGARPALPNQS